MKRLLCLFCLLGALVFLFALNCHFCELLTHLCPWFLLASLIGLYLNQSHPPLSLFFVSLACLFGLRFYQSFNTPELPHQGQSYQNLKIAQFNLLTTNTEHEAVMRWLKQENSDLIGLVEFGAEWQKKAAFLRKEYPDYLEFPDENNFGMALYSRIPLYYKGLVHFSSAAIPALEAVIHLDQGQKKFSLLLVHCMPPVGEPGFKIRNDQLLEIAAWSRKNSPCIVFGDLNLTPFSPWYRIFKQVSLLQDLRTGYQATWPWFLGPLGIPIDHSLASSSVLPLSRQIKPSFGSDHYALSFEIGVPL